MFTYQETLDYLYSFIDYGQKSTYKYSAETFDLSRMFAFLEALGNPHTRYPVLHLAGTKGKGSVSAMCASALRAAGYRTGLYTSPHLIDFCERVQIDGRYIPPAAVAEIVDRMRPVVDAVPGMTTFELTTALAFMYFAREGVDVAVIEVGLGGRLDATNVVAPQVSVITSISYDHTHLLGNTLAEIAAEKGGIIKPGVPVVTAPQTDEALAVIERLAAERGAPLMRVGRDWQFRRVEHTLDSQVFEIWPARPALTEDPLQFEIPLLGLHQVENGVVAYAALRQLGERGLPASIEAIREGLRAVKWPGRFEILGRQPFLIVDGAHNGHSAEQLVATLHGYFPDRKKLLIFGASSDKDIPGMLAALMPHAARVILTQAVHPRAVEPEELCAAVEPYGVPAEPCAPVARALDRAVQLAAPDDVIVACGSLFVVAEVRAAWLQRLQVAG